MKFSEKLKSARIQSGLTQQQLADSLGVSLRTVTNYETGDRYPKKREIYGKLAEILKVNVNYLLTEDEEFVTKAGAVYGTQGALQAQALISQVTGLFAGGELHPDDMDEMMRAIQDAYWIAKERNKKYSGRKKDNR